MPSSILCRKRCLPALLAVAMLVGWPGDAARARAELAESGFFGIQVVDATTGRGVPLVELATVHHVRYWTDSGGWVAFQEPGLMGRETYLHVRSPGYSLAKDWFGYAGVRVQPVAGGRTTIRVERRNVAERLYRVTGEGIDRDTVLLGLPSPRKHPLLSGGVLGQDTVIATPYGGKIHWFWGDTDRAAYPLGNFGASGATSPLPGTGGMDPEAGIDLEYFTRADGFARAMCPEPKDGLRWIESVMTVPDETGRERLVARMAHHRDLGPALGWYLMLWDDERNEFRPIQRWDQHEGHDSAHPSRVRVGGVSYLYLYPNWRVPAQLQSLKDPGRYEAFTCVGGDGRVRGAETGIDRDPEGRARYAWKAGADRLNPGRLRTLVQAGVLKEEEAWLNLRDVETGDPVRAGRGSVAWNAHRGRWIMLVSGKPGEVWYAEADTPTGPWAYARKVVEHGDYNFYNPVHHAFLDTDGGRRIHFEGTYTTAFAAAKEKTPRYEYNQLMYGLSLDDPRLSLPVAVYEVRAGETAEGLERGTRWGTWKDVRSWGAQARVLRVAFFAIEPSGISPDRNLGAKATPGKMGVEDPVWGRVWPNPITTLAWDPEAEPGG